MNIADSFQDLMGVISYLILIYFFAFHEYSKQICVVIITDNTCIHSTFLEDSITINHSDDIRVVELIK